MIDLKLLTIVFTSRIIKRFKKQINAQNYLQIDYYRQFH